MGKIVKMEFIKLKRYSVVKAGIIMTSLSALLSLFYSTADDGKTWNGGYSDNTKAESGGYANQKEKSMSGGDRYGQEM